MIRSGFAVLALSQAGCGGKHWQEQCQGTPGQHAWAGPTGWLCLGVGREGADGGISPSGPVNLLAGQESMVAEAFVAA